ncbi:MAG TPA: tetratricopeptide repeat protein, partial [Armatimonadota bacterium]|nr:tetratricopeptide repeat protein [Armatimonadota bacterium]
KWAEELEPKLRSSDQGRWLRRLEVDHDNVRAALEWSRARGDILEEFRLVVALSRFWDTHGHLREGRVRLEAALSRTNNDLPFRLQGQALCHAAWMARIEDDTAAARTHYGRALDIFREHGARIDIADALNQLGMVAAEEGDFQTARALYEEALALCEDVGGSARLGAVLNNLGALSLRLGDFDAARRYLEQSAAWCESNGDEQLHGLVLHDLSAADLRQARYPEAQAHGTRSLRLLYGCGAVVNIPAALDQMALVSRAQNRWERATLLLGAAEGVRDAAGVPLPRDIALDRADAAAEAKRALGSDAFAAAFAEGQRMSLDESIAYACGPMHVS